MTMYERDVDTPLLEPALRPTRKRGHHLRRSTSAARSAAGTTPAGSQGGCSRPRGARLPFGSQERAGSGSWP